MGYFLPFYSLNPKNQNSWKKRKKPGDIIILHMCAKNYDHVMYGSWDMVCNRQTGRQAERQIDGWKKWHIEVGAPIKKGKFKDLCASATRVVFYI